MALDAFIGSASRLIEAATSSAVIGVPSLNFTPWRILNVHTLASLLADQLVASHGFSCWFSSTQRNSPVYESIAMPPRSLTVIGSGASVGVRIDTRTVPPGLPPPPLLATAPLVDDPLEPPQAVTIAESSGMDMPTTAPRRKNSRRSIRPAVNSSMT